MATITGTVLKNTELGGNQKLLVITATMAAASDTITLTNATHGIAAITGIVGLVATGGLDNAFTTLQGSFSGLVLTIVALKATGAAADNFTGTTISVSVIGV